MKLWLVDLSSPMNWATTIPLPTLPRQGEGLIYALMHRVGRMNATPTSTEPSFL
jgi:hypothetical protein